MSTSVTRATLADLMRHDGKAELIGGRVVESMPTGEQPAEIAENIVESLRAHVRATRRGKAHGDGVGYAIPPLAGSGRESFSPDASYHEWPRSATPMRFINGAPRFAAEVRSETDYGPAAEAEIEAKRDDYFQAGTLVVWDVDPRGEEVRCWVPGAAGPAVFVPGQVADAEPAVPGWRVTVADVFRVDP